MHIVRLHEHRLDHLLNIQVWQQVEYALHVVHDAVVRNKLRLSSVRGNGEKVGVSDRLVYYARVAREMVRLP